jgi:hypothetical protein
MTTRARFLTLGILSLLLAGCIPAISHPPVSRTWSVPDAPDVAYRRVLRTTGALGGMIMQQDPQVRMLQAYVKGTSSLTVSVTPQGTGSEIALTEQVLPTYLTAGPVSHLADEFIVSYHHQP